MFATYLFFCRLFDEIHRDCFKIKQKMYSHNKLQQITNLKLDVSYAYISSITQLKIIRLTIEIAFRAYNHVFLISRKCVLILRCTTVFKVHSFNI